MASSSACSLISMYSNYLGGKVRISAALCRLFYRLTVLEISCACQMMGFNTGSDNVVPTHCNLLSGVMRWFPSLRPSDFQTCMDGCKCECIRLPNPVPPMYLRLGLTYFFSKQWTSVLKASMIALVAARSHWPWHSLWFARTATVLPPEVCTEPRPPNFTLN